VSALEQAEQLFTAAAHAGSASRPLLIFYGLSQAGRALAAAGRMPPGSGWELRSHGLRAPDLSGPLADVPIVQTSKADASFISLSRLLNSPPIPTDPRNGVTIGELWEAIPEAQDRPLRTGTDRRPPMPFVPHDARLPTALLSGTLCRIPRWLAETDGREANFRDFMSAYPHAAGYVMVNEPIRILSQPEFITFPQFAVFPDEVQLTVHWLWDKPATPAERDDKLSSVMTRYNEGWYLMPVVAGNTQPLHPLMAWWALLYALSMLARYQPAQWISYIDVNSSAHAVALEALLDEALLAVPRLIHSTLSALT